MGEWRESTWGEEISLEYGKGIRGYAESRGPYRVFGSNGAVGWADDTIPLAIEPSRLLYEFDRDAYIAALIACAESIVAEEMPAHRKTDST